MGIVRKTSVEGDSMSSQTLCELIEEKKYLKKHFEEYRELVRDARFVCRKCGRVAHREKNLCKPTKL
jgi:hypothetical protein